MTFVQFEYVVLLLAVLVVYHLLGSVRSQNVLLLCAGVLFYGYIHPWLLMLLAYVILVSYGSAFIIHEHGSRTKLYGAVALLIAPLLVFKYFDFFSSSVSALLADIGLPNEAYLLDVLLPIGISFYTFQAIAYVVDVHRGKEAPERDLVNFALFLSFFPQLVAGPIERAGRLLPQIRAERSLSSDRAMSGLCLIAWGYFKKLVVADNCALIVNKIHQLDSPGMYLLLVASFAFAIQIYADFSAYTDIARGSARLLGFRLSENFRHPYFAASPIDFWRRWHVTLYTWIRDYVYVPLGGNAGGAVRQTLSLSLAWLFTGLWHGAAWNFVAWGAYHGALVSAQRVLRSNWPGLGRALPRLLRVAATFCLVCLGWLLFRESDPDYLYRNLKLIDTASAGVAAYLLCLALVYGAPLAVQPFVERRFEGCEGYSQAFLYGLFCGVLVVCIAAMRATHGSDFIYFQF